MMLCIIQVFHQIKKKKRKQKPSRIGRFVKDGEHIFGCFPLWMPTIPACILYSIYLYGHVLCACAWQAVVQ